MLAAPTIIARSSQLTIPRRRPVLTTLEACASRCQRRNARRVVCRESRNKNDGTTANIAWCTLDLRPLRNHNNLDPIAPLVLARQFKGDNKSLHQYIVRMWSFLVLLVRIP